MLKKWVPKAIVQKVISFLPFSHRINYFFQSKITKGVVLADENFEDKLIHANEHIFAYNKYLNCFDNKIQLQSRSRMKDYIMIYKELKIPCLVDSIREGIIKQLDAIKLNYKYSLHTKQELTISHCYLYSSYSIK